MMKNTSKAFVALPIMVVLSACGGGGTSPSVPSYETLLSTAATTSNLGGTAIRFNSTSAEMTTISGTTTHNTGSTTVSDGTYTMTDPDGLDQNSQLTDGSATAEVIISPTYDYMAAATFDYTSGGVPYESVGIVGITTNSADIPTSGTATYSGQAMVSWNDGTNYYEQDDGNSTVVANFAVNTVDVTLNGFTSADTTDMNSGSTTTGAAIVGTVSLNGMAINGSNFAGGTYDIMDPGGASIDPISGTSASSSGNFYGYDSAISAPDEVGGLFLETNGSNHIFVGTYVAD